MLSNRFSFQNWHILLRRLNMKFVKFLLGRGMHGEKATLLEIKLEICQHMAKLHLLGQIELFAQMKLVPTYEANKLATCEPRSYASSQNKTQVQLGPIRI